MWRRRAASWRWARPWCRFWITKGAPTPVERALVVPPESRVGTITAEERQALRQASLLHDHYREAQDRESA